MKKHKNKIIAGAVITVILALAFWWGGGAPGLHGWKSEAPYETAEATKAPAKSKKVRTTLSPEATETPEPTDDTEETDDKPQNEDDTPMTAEEKIEWAEAAAEDLVTEMETGSEEYSEQNGMRFNENTGRDLYQTEPVPEGKPVPIDPQEAVISDNELICTLSVRCDAILKNISWLDKEKRELVPNDGVIFEEQPVTFYEGESVFNLLLREMKKNKIHMEYTNIPLYNSAYIDGINNIYEFDCGELSGWMYKVNDWFPNYGCSRYQLHEGDKVEIVYSCNLGLDVGGFYSARNGK